MLGWIAARADLIAATLLMAGALTYVMRQQLTGAMARKGGGAANQARPPGSSVVGAPEAAAFVIVVAAFIVPVFAYWYSGRSHPNALAGLLPWSDAHLYFVCATQVLTSAPLQDMCEMRPFYSAMLSVNLWIGRGDLQSTLIIQAATLGAASFFLLRETGRHLSTAANIAVFAALFLFASRFCAAITLTENAGFLLGTLAMAILWRGAGGISASTFFFAMLFSTIAQTARAGAFFVLPALLAWSLIHPEEGKRRRIVMATAGTLAIIAGFALNWVLTKELSGTSKATLSNFSYILYGLSAGGKRWLQIMTDHPEIFEAGVGELEVRQMIYRAAFDNIVNQPHLFVKGYLLGIAHYFYDLFRFVEFLPLRLLFVALWLLGLAVAVVRRKDPRFSMLLWMALGVLVSGPFLTFNGGNRLYAVTFPMDAILVGIGFAGLSWFVPHLRDRTPQERPSPWCTMPASRAVMMFGIIVTVIGLAGPRMVQAVVASSPVSAPACEGGLETVVVRPGRESPYVTLVEPGDESIFPLRVRTADFAGRMDQWVHLAEELGRLPAGTTLVWGYRLRPEHYGRPILLRWHGNRPIPDGALVRFCVQPASAGMKLKFGIAKTMSVLAPAE